MRRRGLIAALLAACFGNAAQAGQDCEAARLATHEVQQSLNLALRTAQALDRSGAVVAVIGRAGQDLSAHGQRYSHLGIAYKEPQADGVAVWRVVHKLNHCGSASAGIYRQGLGEFFMDRPHRYEARIALLDPALQAQLWQRLSVPAELGRVHEPAYSMVAYAWSRSYQQSNQWVVETLASMTGEGIDNRAQAQSWLVRHDYRPSTAHIPAAQRLAARMTAAHIAFDDHPGHLRYSGQIQTVTADSVFDWLGQAYPKTRFIELR